MIVIRNRFEPKFGGGRQLWQWRDRML